MNYGELTKAYPEFKIPYHKYADYYIETLIEAGLCNERPMTLLKDLESSDVVAGKYKMQMLDKVLEGFKEEGWDLNLLNMEDFKSDYSELEFNDYKKDKYYISIDLRQANWQAFKFAFNLNLPKWETWVEKEFETHQFYSESKSWRQLVFGNTNPKRLQTIQKYMMNKLISKLTSEMKEAIVARKSDELILELNYYPIVHAFMFDELSKWSGLEVKVNCFQVETLSSFDETIKVKHFFDLIEKTSINTKLMSISGNRFFIHLKNIILKKPVLEKDLFFEHDRKLAQWVI